MMSLDFLHITSVYKLFKYSNEDGVYVNPLDIEIPDILMEILQYLFKNGYTSLIVGGAVRDALIGAQSKDIDIEVYGISYDELLEYLKKYGDVNLVGKAFGVIKYTDNEGNDYDFSIPRRDSKVDSSSTRGRGFVSEFDNNITPKEAASRRDFTINAIAYNPITQELHDYFGGSEDLENKVLRATSSAFMEDPLRVLRGMQFAARFGMEVEPETAKMCASLKNEPLVAERINEEWMKLFTKAKYPSFFIQYLIDTEWIDNYPELKDIINLEQDSAHHPEGTVDVHSALTMEAASDIADREGLSGDDKAVLMISALTHDFGKATTTSKDETGKIISHGHHTEGVSKVESFLNRLHIKKDITQQVLPLVEHHMDHIWYDSNNKGNNVRQLAEKLNNATIKQLLYVIESDHSGRPPLPGGLPDQAQLLKEDAVKEDVYEGKIQALLSGREILDMFPSVFESKELGDVLKILRNEQLKGTITTKEDAINKANKLLQKYFLYINGNDVLSFGISGPNVGMVLDEVWKLQNSGVISSREDALTYINDNYFNNENSDMQDNTNIFSEIKSLNDLYKYSKSSRDFYKIKNSKDLLDGGLADNQPDSKYDEHQLEMGIEVEYEHTNNPDISKEIAKDHLEEIPDYYDRLEEMEESYEEERKPEY